MSQKTKVQLIGTDLWLGKDMSLVDADDAPALLIETAHRLAKRYSTDWKRLFEFHHLPDPVRLKWYKAWSVIDGQRHRTWVSARSGERARKIMRELTGQWSGVGISSRRGRFKPVKEMNEWEESVWIALDERKRLYRKIK